MHHDVVDCFLRTWDVARQAKVLVGRIERYSREMCEDDWKMPRDSVSRVWPRIKLPHLTTWAVDFGNFSVRRWSASAGMIPNVVSLLSPDHDATMK